tara:strand:+ start:740 stop:961 length:222 start_codon:yes stop_codon:yes gene_type:complete
MNKKKIKVYINGKIIYFEEKTTIYKMLKKLKIKPNNIAIECNLEIINRSQYGQFKIDNDYKIEIVNFIGGGKL